MHHVACSFFLVFLAVLLSGCGDDASSSDPFVADAGGDAIGRDAIGPDAIGPDGTALDGAMVDAAGDTTLEATGDTNPHGNLPPTASLDVSPRVGASPLEAVLDASGSADPDGSIVAYSWDFGDGASGDGVSLHHTYSTPGCFRVVLTVTDDDGLTDQAATTVVVTQGVPTGTPAVSFEAFPKDMSVLPRDPSTNIGTATVRGTVGSAGYDSILVEVSQGSTVVHSVGQDLCSEAQADPFDLAVPVPAVLKDHTIRVYLVAAGERTPVARANDVVAGDVFIVQGQSNAVARQHEGDANGNQGPFLRSFGTRSGATTLTDTQWHQAEGNAGIGPGAVGQWSLRMGRLLVERHQVPIAILNGAEGGKPIEYFQRNDSNPTDTATNYGRMLSRVRAAGLEHGIRAILYYQGENDGSNAQGHRSGWISLHEAWLEDYPSVARTYVTQVRSCGGAMTELRDAQRRLADELPQVSVMSTHGLDGHDGCHFAYAEGYKELGEWYAGLLGRDLFGAAKLPDIEAPNVGRVYFSNGNGTELTIEMRDGESTMSWDPGAQEDFVVEGKNVTVKSGQATGSKVVLVLSGSATGASGLTYLGHRYGGRWVTNASGIGLLTFQRVPIDPSPN